jgi:hypothetical protein
MKTHDMKLTTSRGILCGAFLLGGCLAESSAQQIVTTVSELYSAVGKANSGSGDKTILVADGTYTLDSGSLVLSADGITVRSLSGFRDAVILEGQGMSSTAVRQIFQVAADDVTIESLTLRLVKNHAIQVHGEPPYDADAVVLRDLRIEDTGEQMVKVSYGGSGTGYCDGGLLEDSEFEYTAGIGPQYYIGGIDAHAARNWTVRGNTFRGIRSPDSNVAEHAIHFWSDSENTVCEQNVIINCDRGIGFGLGDRGHVGGVIRNNMIYHADLGSYDRGDVGIELENASGAKVYNNTVYQEHDYEAAISVRWPGSTDVHVANNLILKNGSLTYGIWRRDGCTVLVENNYIGPLDSWFLNPVVGDLHLAGQGNENVVNRGMALPGLTDDFDGEPRPLGSGIEIGADEIAAGSSPIQQRSWGGLKDSYR